MKPVIKVIGLILGTGIIGGILMDMGMETTGGFMLVAAFLLACAAPIIYDLLE